jgi:hypothetical protein
MERPEPKKGDPLIDRGYHTTIYRFDDDLGTGLYNGGWVCISEFEKGEDGVWRRPEPHGLTGLVDLERPVGESALDDLAEAALLVRRNPTRFTQFYGTAELLAAVFDSWARMGRQELSFLNRVGGAETVRLARHIIKTAGQTG